MIDSAQLLADLRGQLKLLEADLTARADDVTNEWGAALRVEHADATARKRTGLPWIDWRNGQVAQAAVAWILATVFIRFAEDNDLLEGVSANGARVALPWLAGPGDRLERAVEHQSAYFTANPTAAGPDWLKHAFSALASLPAGRALVDPAHSPVWTAPISGEAADQLLGFWRAVDAGGTLLRDFTDPGLDTRFLGDLYQDLSEFAKKQYALLQTPMFVEEFILDQTLTPAIAEFGLEGLKLIDPTCGSGHFLLGAFGRLVEAWAIEAPAMDVRERVARALASVHGVDLNPFAVAIARLRLTVAALRAAGDRTLVAAPAYHLQLAIGDSLLGSQASSVQLFDGEDADAFEYSVEDLAAYHGILQQNQYHVVVGNPPYITVKDPVLNKQYRQLYKTCHRQYALSVPFMELFFELAKRSDATTGAGFVGQITSNSFMKREFGKKLIEQFLSGKDSASPVDLTAVIDTSGAYIPGHGTPTVILVGRRRKPLADTVRSVLGVRGEPGQPSDPAQGLVWSEIVSHFADEYFNGDYVTVVELSRTGYAQHPWSLSGGGASAVFEQLEAVSVGRLAARLGETIGGSIRAGADEAFMRPRRLAFEASVSESIREFVVGDGVRDYEDRGSDLILFPYDDALRPSESLDRVLWPWRASLANRSTFQGLMADAGLRWTEYMQFTRWAARTSLAITFAFVATHNHFVLDRGGKVFKQSAPVIKLPEGATEGQHLELLGLLNSSTACFWLKQVSHDKGNGGIGGGIADQEWERFFEFTGTKLQELPLPARLPLESGAALDASARQIFDVTPASVIEARDSALSTSLEIACASWDALREHMVFLQEELDWEVYHSYGLIDEELTYRGELDRLRLGQRTFEIVLARKVAASEEQTAWFERHSSTPITDFPAEWPDDYRAIVERRLEATESNPSIRLLERPEFKRRWATRSWDDQLADALRDAMLDHMESPALWTDVNGRPVTRSVNELADLVKSDAWFAELASLAHGADADLRTVIAKLLDDESVPYLAALRYKPSGLEKFRAWEHAWDLQRAEDHGERVEVPVPPKYGQGDFRKATYWKARGKLDVPKERFISYPGTRRANDQSPLYGWAGWNHADRAQALARLPMEMLAAGAISDELAPLISGLIELQPWLDQWHAEPDANLGVSPAGAISGLTDQLLTQLRLSRDAVTAWQPPASTRGRAASKGTK
ncbi:BREX-2 system adenine-specific DNA-methyltransferase PglX [Curtobacterium sp. YR515]|uniref:BREX-2 system adenine-specific DNA-methyltransferase PglX n=1 Tax=Curtobacterium sp. YR515 TaxID=1855316 RepID=UPI0008E78C04|nr:BREX-2 system adenine-specific DNA-methyltransferase PglX [Curtobacterium sp. YR515]SFF91252.1 hypothetical protein SAMN05216329_3248 [Curtobacterium sp. YR515]